MQLFGIECGLLRILLEQTSRRCRRCRRQGVILPDLSRLQSFYLAFGVRRHCRRLAERGSSRRSRARAHAQVQISIILGNLSSFDVAVVGLVVSLMLSGRTGRNDRARRARTAPLVET